MNHLEIIFYIKLLQHKKKIIFKIKKIIFNKNNHKNKYYLRFRFGGEKIKVFFLNLKIIIIKLI